MAAFVAFRGTTNNADWGTNSRLRKIPSTLGGGARVHRGFAESWESVKDQVFEELVDLAPERIVLTGHSLGGACAVLASTDIIARFAEVPVDLVTFGAPRCGNLAYSEAIAEKVSSHTRVVHDNDIVPSMPSVVFGYAHPNTEWLHIIDGDSKADIKLVWKKPEDGWWFDMRTMFARLFAFDGISDHHVEKYINGCGGGREAE
jgi:predicted lipase